jgi:hypothetical protein
MEKVKLFADAAAEKTKGISDITELRPIEVKGIPSPYRGYYQPRDRQETRWISGR